MVGGPAPERYPILGYLSRCRCASRVEKSIYTDDYRRLCRLLHTLRTEAGLTQVQIAERLGVPQSFVSKYEAGQRRLDVIELGNVAEALGTTTAAILDRLAAEQ